MAKRTFLVTIDANDGDYQSNIVSITDEEFEKFLPLIRAINEFKPYVTYFGVDHSNFRDGELLRSDYGEMSPEQLYGVSEEMIGEFSCAFLNFGTDYGMHSIINIQEVFLGERFIYGDYESQKKKIDADPSIQEYYKKTTEYRNYITKVGKPLNSTPFADMTAEELVLCRRMQNLWKCYNPMTFDMD